MEHLPKVLWPQSFSFSFPLETYWKTRTIYFWKYWIEYLIFPGVIFILIGISRRPERLHDALIVEFQALRKSGKLWRGGETVLAQVWCILPDNTALLMTSWKILLRALTWSMLSWFGFKLNCSVIHKTSCYHLPRLSPTSELHSFPEKFLVELRKAAWEIASLLHSQKWYP